jgi:DNA-binding response OmpR family regulator
VLDVMLPDTDGFEVVARLRRDGLRVPVIFLTARDTQADKVNGLTIGGDDYLTKPFGLEELAARIRTVLRRTRPTTACARSNGWPARPTRSPPVISPSGSARRIRGPR